MGNIAATPRDVARFFYLLANASLTTQASLDEMRTYHNLTEGFGAGGGKYGLGLMEIKFGAKDQRDVTGKVVNWTQSWGHVGEDWGSNMQFNGYFPNLGVAMALATNAAGPMNFSKGHRSNAGGLSCRLSNAVFQYLRPNEPALRCT
jgi:CubicO group peptidase (beta-lactamase class C family)